MASSVILPIGGGFVQRNPWTPDLALATKIDVGGVEVTPPVTLGGVTTVTFDATKPATNPLVYVSPIKDPDGTVITKWLDSGGLRTAPYMCLDIPPANAPTPGEGVDVVVGISDGSALVQWAGFGIRYDDGSGGKPITIAHDLAAAENLPVPGGAFSAGDFSATASLTVSGIFFRFIRTTLGVNAVPPASLSQQAQPNDDYQLQPYFFVMIIPRAGSANTAMTIKFTAAYQALFAIA